MVTKRLQSCGGGAGTKSGEKVFIFVCLFVCYVVVCARVSLVLVYILSCYMFDIGVGPTIDDVLYKKQESNL